MVIFILQQQNWVVGTESVWLAKPKIFSIWPSTEEASGFLVLSVDHREPSDPRGNKQLLHKHSNIKDELAANDGGPTWNRRYHEAPCRRSHCHFSPRTSEVGQPMTLYLNENTRPGAGHGLSGTSSPCFSHEATISWEFAHVFILMFFEIWKKRITVLDTIYIWWEENQDSNFLLGQSAHWNGQKCYLNMPHWVYVARGLLNFYS